MKQKKNRRNLLSMFGSIQMAILIPYTVLVGIALSAALLIAMHFNERDVRNNSIQYTGLMIEQVAGELDSYITYMENISAMVANSRDVRRYLEEDGTRSDLVQIRQRILTQYGLVAEAREDIANIGIIRADGRRYLINDGDDALNPYGDLSKVDWFAHVVNGEGQYLTSSHVQNVIYNDYRWVVTLSRCVYGSDGSCAGVFFVDLNYRVIRNLCEKVTLGEDGYVYLLDSGQEMVYHPKQQLWFSGFLQEYVSEIADSDEPYVTRKTGTQVYLYTKRRSEKTGWTVVGVVNAGAMMKGAALARQLYPVIFFALLAAAAGISIALSSSISNPLRHLVNGIRRMEQGDFSRPVSLEDAGGELNRLVSSFNRMENRISCLMEENTRQQEEKRISELQALQAQINPHFLYNTLDSIIWMAEDGQNEEVVRMTSSLAKLLRQSITNEEKTVCLEKEISYVENYLTIQKMRYKDKLEYQIDAQPEVFHCRIVKLVLQPLVENAIYHGIKYIEGTGVIRVSVRLEDGWICLEISDNGAGMDGQTLAHILEPKPAGKGRKGVGVANVNQRLILEYGPESRLHFASSPGCGTTVSFRIPRQDKSEVDV